MEVMKMEDKKPVMDDTFLVGPECRELSCFACESGRCTALRNTDFHMKRCPFYKTREQVDTERLDALENLVEKGRYDLILKYESVLRDLGVLDFEDSFIEENRSTVNYLAGLRALERQIRNGKAAGGNPIVWDMAVGGTSMDVAISNALITQSEESHDKEDAADPWEDWDDE